VWLTDSDDASVGNEELNRMPKDGIIHSVVAVLDIFIHQRGGRTNRKRNSDNNNNNMEEGSNLTNLTISSSYLI